MGRVEGPGRSLWGEGELPWLHHVMAREPVCSSQASIVKARAPLFAWLGGVVPVSRSLRRVGLSVVCVVVCNVQ